MNLEQIEAMKKRMERQAHKWIIYLESCATVQEREKELTRLLCETYLEGRQSPP